MRWYSGLAGVAAVLTLTAPALAQGRQEQLKAKLEKKKGEAWIKNPKWITDYDEAKKQAKSSGKVILGYFTRSYAY